MSKAELEHLKQAALALSVAERADLASTIMASLDGPQDADVAAAWDLEICRRINDIAAGTAQLLEADEVLARARARLHG